MAKILKNAYNAFSWGAILPGVLSGGLIALAAPGVLPGTQSGQSGWMLLQGLFAVFAPVPIFWLGLNVRANDTHAKNDSSEPSQNSNSNLKLDLGANSALTTGLANGFIAGTLGYGVWLSWFLGLYPLDWLGLSDGVSLLVAGLAWGICVLTGGLIWGVCSALSVWAAQRMHAYPVWLWSVLTAVWFELGLAAAAWALPSGFPWVRLAYAIAPNALIMAGLGKVNRLSAGHGFLMVSLMLWCVSAFVAWVGFCSLMAVRQKKQDVKGACQPFLKSGLACIIWLGVVLGVAYPLQGSSVTRLDDLNQTIVTQDQILPKLLLSGRHPKSQKEHLKKANELSKRSLAVPRVYIFHGDLPPPHMLGDPYAAKMNQMAYPFKQASLEPGSVAIFPEEGPLSGWVIWQHPEENDNLRWLRSQAKQKQVTVLTGASVWDARLSRGYNVLLAIAPDGSLQYYAKRHLVPYGESMPDWLIALQAALKQIQVLLPLPKGHYFAGSAQPKLLSVQNLQSVLMSDRSKTNSPNKTRLKPDVSRPLRAAHPERPYRLGSLICAEVMSPALTAAYLQKNTPDALVLIGNTGWFHQHKLVRQQMLRMAWVRSGEVGRPFLFVINGGPSGWIMPENGF